MNKTSLSDMIVYDECLFADFRQDRDGQCRTMGIGKLGAQTGPEP